MEGERKQKDLLGLGVVAVEVARMRGVEGKVEGGELVGLLPEDCPKDWVTVVEMCWFVGLLLLLLCGGGCCCFFFLTFFFFFFLVVDQRQTLKS